MEQRKIFLTGLNGLAGWHLYLRFKKAGIIRGTYRRFHAGLEAPDCLKLDLEDSKALSGFIREFDPEWIIHAWSICDLDLCEQEPEMAWRINVEGTRRLLEAAESARRISRFIYLSTDHVFDGRRGLYTENDIPNPKHVYGRTKCEAENLVISSGLPYLIVRSGLVLGKSLQGNKGPRDFLFSRIRAGKPTHLFTDEWRTPVNAEALAERTFELAAEGKQGIYHVAGESVVNRFDLGMKLAQEEGLATQLIFPRLRMEDRWAHIRPEFLTLRTAK